MVFQQKKNEKTIERRDRQLREIHVKMDAAAQEMEAAVHKASHLREQLDRTNQEFDNAKTALNHATKELKVSENIPLRVDRANREES